MKNNIILIVILSIFIYALCGCNNNYYPESGAAEQNSIEVSSELEVTYTEYENILQNAGCVAESDECYYIGLETYGFFVLDKERLEISPVCKKATCTHTSSDCVSTKAVNCIKNYNGEIIFTSGDDNKIYTLNQDSYEVSVFYTVDTDKNLACFERYNDKLIFSMSDNEGNGGWYIEDINSGEKNVLIDRLCYRNIAIDNGNLYLTTTEMEMYCINLDTLEKSLISDGLGRNLVLCDGRIYFLRYNLEAGAAFLYSMNTDGTDEKLIMENVLSFRVWDNKIYYISDNKDIISGNSLYLMDLEGNNKHEIINKVQTYDELFVLPNSEKLIMFNPIGSVTAIEYSVMSLNGDVLNTKVVSK